MVSLTKPSPDALAYARSEAPADADGDGPTFLARLDEARVREPEPPLYEASVKPDWSQYLTVGGLFLALVAVAVAAPWLVPEDPALFRIVVIIIAVVQALMAGVYFRIRIRLDPEALEVRQGPFHRRFPLETIERLENGRRDLFGFRVGEGRLPGSRSIRLVNRHGDLLVLHRTEGYPVVLAPADVDALRRRLEPLIAA